MPVLSTAINKRETLNLRIKSEEKTLIDRAAKVLGKNRTEFVLEAARMVAEETLFEQAVIKSSQKEYDLFLVRLDIPPQPNERLRKTMQMPAPWDTK
jgi:uncharacterized protein (DUF1778 family)